MLGIWLSKSQGAPFLILDVEGTDGRERGENQVVTLFLRMQDFERKAALFSLAIAQVVIINMWEYSVGLYNAANMVLLKTVLEVHAQLFQNQKRYSIERYLITPIVLFAQLCCLSFVTSLGLLLFLSCRTLLKMTSPPFGHLYQAKTRKGTIRWKITSSLPLQICLIRF